MFGLFEGRRLKATAGHVKVLAERVIEQYLRLDPDQLESRLRGDFPKSLFSGHLNMSFTFPEEPEFRFVIDLGGVGGSVADRFLSVFGEGQFLGFMLSASDDSPWNSSASDGLQYRATRRAKALARTFETALGIRDISEFMR